MSFAVNPLKTVRVVDPRVNFSNERMYSVLTGGSQVSWKQFTTTSYTTSSFNFSAPPPNPGICVDPKVYISTGVELTFKANKVDNTGATIPWVAGDRVLRDGYDSFRAFPISSVTNTLAVRLNNSQASINLSDIVPYILRYNTDFCTKEYDYSVCPSMMDTYQTYDSGVATSRNPLGSYGNSSFFTTRGAFPYKSVNNPGTAAGTTEATATLTAVITEPIFLSPFLFGKGSEARNGFIGIQTFDFAFNFVSADELRRIWSHSTLGSGSEGVKLNSIGVVFKDPQLLFNYITPKLLEPIPRSISYSYMTIERYPTDKAGVNPNSDFSISSNNIQINTIPRRIYIFARRKNGYKPTNAAETRTIELDETTDTFAALKSITINYNNQSGILSGASQQQLYNISKKNGVNLSFPEWCGNALGTSGSDTAGTPYKFDATTTSGATMVGLTGSILCLEWGIDIGLDDLHAPGEVQNSQLQINANFSNISPYKMDFTFYIVVVSEGVWTVENLNSVAQIGVLSKEDILNARTSSAINYESSNTIYGGDFLSDIGNFGKKVLNGLTQALPVARDVAGLIAPFLGAGANNGGVMVGGNNGGVMVGGNQNNSSSSKGGKMVNRSELYNRLKMN